MKRTAFWLLVAGLGNLVPAAIAALKPNATWVEVIPRTVFSLYLFASSYWSFRQTRTGYLLVSFLCLFISTLLLISPFVIVGGSRGYEPSEIALLFITHLIGVVLIWLTWYKWWRPLCEKAYVSNLKPGHGRYDPGT
jgi:hypothetical protein